MSFYTDVVKLDIPSQYNLDVVHKCFYWYTKEYNVEIVPSGNGTTVHIMMLEGSFNESSEKKLRERVNRDLIDYYLRERIRLETKTIRELIIAKAFSPFDDDTLPSGAVSDPVGFDPLNANDDAG